MKTQCGWHSTPWTRFEKWFCALISRPVSSGLCKECEAKFFAEGAT